MGHRPAAFGSKGRFTDLRKAEGIGRGLAHGDAAARIGICPAQRVAKRVLPACLLPTKVTGFGPV